MSEMDMTLKVLALMITIFVFVLASTWGVVGWLVSSLKRALTDKLDTMSTALKEEALKIAHVERSLLELKAELPREYVRREDHIRYSAVIEAKLDAHGEALHNIKLSLQRFVEQTKTGGPQQ